MIHLVSKYVLTTICIYYMIEPGGQVVTNLPANAGDAGSIPGLGLLPGKFHGERSLVGFSHGVTKSWT